MALENDTFPAITKDTAKPLVVMVIGRKKPSVDIRQIPLAYENSP